jgi:hypothetical protein
VQGASALVLGASSEAGCKVQGGSWDAIRRTTVMDHLSVAQARPSKAARIDSHERSTSSSVVDQFETEIRIP